MADECWQDRPVRVWTRDGESGLYELEIYPSLEAALQAVIRKAKAEKRREATDDGDD